MTGQTFPYQGITYHEYTCCTSGTNTGEVCGEYRATPPPSPPGQAPGSCSQAGRPQIPNMPVSMAADADVCWCVVPDIFTQACSLDLDEDPSNGFQVTSGL